MANANSKIYFACGANKKAFGQIDQPKGTKPREIRTPGVRRKVELRLQRADRQQTKKTKNKPKKRFGRMRVCTPFVILLCAHHPM